MVKKLKKIALFEAEFSKKIVEAGVKAQQKGLAQIVFIGDKEKIINENKNLDLKNISFIDYKNNNCLDHMCEMLYELRKHKGITKQKAYDLLNQPVYFATMLLKMDKIDGVVGGAQLSTADCLRPAFEIIRAKKDGQIISSFFILKSKDKSFGERGIMLVADCAINQNPTAQQLFEIAQSTYESSKMFIKKPKIAFLSYSTCGSGNGEDVEKVRNAANMFKKQYPKICVEGEVQADVALEAVVAQAKCPKSALKGDANILIFPDLQSGNIGYKLLRYGKKLKAIGPICQNIAKPYNDVSRGATVDEIVDIIEITAKR